MPHSKISQVNRPTFSMTLPLSPHYAIVLAELARERGFDGYLLNFECPLTGGFEQTRALAAWITLLQSEILTRVGPHGETHWFVIFTPNWHKVTRFYLGMIASPSMGDLHGRIDLIASISLSS